MGQRDLGEAGRGQAPQKTSRKWQLKREEGSPPPLAHPRVQGLGLGSSS